MSKTEINPQTDKIFIYTEGKCTELLEQAQLNTHVLASSFQLTQQIDTLTTMFISLADTVNKNALYMHKLGMENGAKPGSRSNLDGYLKASNKVYQGMLDEHVKSTDTDQQIKKLVRLGSDEEDKTFHRNMLLKESLLKSILDNQVDQAAMTKKYDDRLMNLEVVQDNLKMKVDFLTEGTKNPKGTAGVDPTQLAMLEKQYKNLEGKLKKCSSSDNLSEEIERLEGFLTDKIERTDKKLNELTDNFDDFVKEQRKKFENLDIKDMREDLNQLERQMSDFKSRFDNDFKGLRTEISEHNSKLSKKVQGLLQDISNKPIVDGQGRETKPFDTMEFMLNEITERVNDIESEFSKRLITIDNQLKEFDDISKINKMISKITVELNNKLNRDIFESSMSLVLYKNDFYDFVNKNLIKKDKLNTFKYELTEFKEYVNNNLKEQDSFAKKLKNTFDSGIDDLEIKINRFSGDIHKNDGIITSLNNKVKAVEKDLESISKKHKELRQWIADQFTSRLNSLATSTGIRCLSCGEKDVSYPPVQKFSMGADGQLYQYQDDKYIYMNGIREDIRAPNENLAFNPIPSKPQSANKPNGFRLLSATTDTTKARLTSAKPMFEESETKKQYTLGHKVFSKQQIIHEHNVKQHMPVEQTISMQPKFRNRPFSSIPVKQSLRN